jgi:hypothetical protein
MQTVFLYCLPFRFSVNQFPFVRGNFKFFSFFIHRKEIYSIKDRFPISLGPVVVRVWNRVSSGSF